MARHMETHMEVPDPLPIWQQQQKVQIQGNFARQVLKQRTKYLLEKKSLFCWVFFPSFHGRRDFVWLISIPKQLVLKILSTKELFYTEYLYTLTTFKSTLNGIWNKPGRPIDSQGEAFQNSGRSSLCYMICYSRTTGTVTNVWGFSFVRGHKS